MAQNFIESGERKDYVLGGTVTSGQLVEIGDMVGVALGSGVSGETVAVALEGVFEVAKTTGTGTGITLGQKLYSNGSGAVTTDSNSGANKVAGYAWTAATTTAAVVQVKLLLS
jgi:predicted RecA/RadA family phage recombinase